MEQMETKKVEPAVKKEVRKFLSVNIDGWYLFEGSLQEVARKILALEERVQKECIGQLKGHEWLRFELSVSDFYDGFEVVVYAVRLETDEEYDKRMNQARIHQEAAEKRERTLLANLKQKYEQS